MPPADVSKLFSLTYPCVDCPFRRHGGVRLHNLKRAADLAGYALGTSEDGGRGAIFHCHQTTGVAGRPRGRKRQTKKMCAGAVLFAKKHGFPAAILRIAIAVGALDPDSLRGEDEVFDSRDEMLEANS